MAFVEFMHSLNVVTVLIRLALAVLAGGILGLERKKAQHAAGMRTYMVVCLGMALVTLTSQFMYENFSTDGSHADISRIASTSVQAIAVLAASMIVVSKKLALKGITTAASMLAAACIGLAFGIGFYTGGLITTGIVFVIMSYFYKIETDLLIRSTTISLYCLADSKDTILNVIQELSSKDVDIKNMRFETKDEIIEEGYNPEEDVLAVFALQSKKLKQNDLMSLVGAVTGVKKARISI